jgi:hypothetical protein
VNDLERIDLIRARVNVSYREAKAALDAADGDVLQALIRLEDEGKTSQTEHGARFTDKGCSCVGGLSEIFSKEELEKKLGYKIKLKQGERTVAEIPAPLGALGLLGAFASSQIAIAGVLASVAGLANNYSLEVKPPS